MTIVRRGDTIATILQANALKELFAIPIMSQRAGVAESRYMTLGEVSFRSRTSELTVGGSGRPRYQSQRLVRAL